MSYIKYTADNEMPDCGRCDYVCGGIDCESQCGPKYGWAGYCRTEREEENGEYKFSIKAADTGMYLTEEDNGKCSFGIEADRLLFYDETEAEGVLEYLNDATEHCCVLLDENR